MGMGEDRARGVGRGGVGWGGGQRRACCIAAAVAPPGPRAPPPAAGVSVRPRPRWEAAVPVVAVPAEEPVSVRASTRGMGEARAETAGSDSKSSCAHAGSGGREGPPAPQRFRAHMSCGVSDLWQRAQGRPASIQSLYVRTVLALVPSLFGS
jgi:hypothetical protein